MHLRNAGTYPVHPRSKALAPGTKLLVEKTADGLLLKLLSIVTPTDIEALRIAMVERAIVVGG